MPFCSKCGMQNLDGAAFCSGCGAPLVQTPAASQCPRCGAPIFPNMIFCSSCGCDLRKSSAQTTPPQQARPRAAAAGQNVADAIGKIFSPKKPAQTPPQSDDGSFVDPDDLFSDERRQLDAERSGDLSYENIAPDDYQSEPFLPEQQGNALYQQAEQPDEFHPEDGYVPYQQDDTGFADDTIPPQEEYADPGFADAQPEPSAEQPQQYADEYGGSRPPQYADEYAPNNAAQGQQDYEYEEQPPMYAPEYQGNMPPYQQPPQAQPDWDNQQQPYYQQPQQPDYGTAPEGWEDAGFYDDPGMAANPEPPQEQLAEEAPKKKGGKKSLFGKGVNNPFAKPPKQENTSEVAAPSNKGKVSFRDVNKDGYYKDVLPDDYDDINASHKNSRLLPTLIFVVAIIIFTYLLIQLNAVITA